MDLVIVKMRHREMATEKRCSHPNEMRDDIEVIEQNCSKINGNLADKVS